MLQITDKIDSFEKLKEVLAEYAIDDLKNAVAYGKNVPTPNVAWWVAREKRRMAEGHYEQTAALEKLNKLNNSIFAHISKTDRNMVAFTPDKAAGEADRQIITSFGKLASRVMPFVTDDYIRDLTAEHLGDVCNDIEFLEGQAIVDAYARKTGFPESCMMANSPTAKAWPAGLAPSQAYMMPNIKMAILRDPKNPDIIIARSMVVEVNGEKRYIRANYGDPKLERRLIRAGYQKSGWMDVEFNMVPYDNGEPLRPGYGRFLMPYLDSHGGACKEIGSSLVYMDGKLKGVNKELYEKLDRACLHGFRQIPSTRGWIEIPELTEEKYSVTDIITGRKLNKFTDQFLTVMHNGQRGPAMVNRADWASLRDRNDDGSFDCYFPITTPAFYAGGYSWVDSDSNRKFKGFVKLSAEFYPDEQEWRSNWELDTFTDATGKEFNVKHGDAVFWIENGVCTKRMKSQITKTDVKLHRETDKNADCYVPKGELIYRSASGRKVHPEYNELRMRWDGIYDFPRNVLEKHFYGENVYIARKGHDVEAFNEWKKGLLQSTVNRVGPGIRERILYLFGLYGFDWSRINYKLRGENVYRRPNEFVPHADYEELKAMLTGWRDSYNGDRDRNAVVNNFLREMAETEAIDYNQLPQVTHEQVQAAIIDAEVQQPEVVAADYPF